LGNVSVKLTACAGLFTAGLVIVNVSVVVPPLLMVFGLDALFKLGVCAVTLTQLAVTALLTLTVPLMLLAALVKLALGQLPVCSATLVTSTAIVHVLAAAVLAGTV